VTIPNRGGGQFCGMVMASIMAVIVDNNGGYNDVDKSSIGDGSCNQY